MNFGARKFPCRDDRSSQIVAKHQALGLSHRSFLIQSLYTGYTAMWLICISIKIHKNTTNSTDVVCPYCSSSQRSAVVFSAHPALDEYEVLFCITKTHLHLRRKIGFGKSKMLVTVFHMLKCERTGNLYKHANSPLELCRTCAESMKREVHTSLKRTQIP